MSWATLLLLCSCCLTAARGQLVDTIYGPIQGHTVVVDDTTIINSFYGIPFAKPPVGELRFRAPEQPDPWDETFVAYDLPSACPQGGGLIAITHPLWNNFNEDCLTLNLFAPNDTSGAPYPVMVWFHGGAYGASANIQYPGHFLAAKGVVVVVVNYRLGALGFMSTGDDVAPGNWGMLDQVLSLEFVRDNIRGFGGNPDMVTIFGQSAGASSSGLHMLSPKSRGLFHQAICESGSDMAFWATNPPGMEPENYTKHVAGRLNCPNDDSAEMMDCLRQLDANLIRNTSGFPCASGYYCLGFSPVVDGPDGFMPDHPWNLRRQGEFADVKLISGITSDDGSLYTIGLVPESLERGFNRTEFLDILRYRLIGIFAPRFPEREEDGFEASNFFYSPWPYLDDLDQNREQFNIMTTDFGFGSTTDQQLKYHTQKADTWSYILSMRSANAGEVVPEWMGVPHNGELPYVWGWPKLKGNLDVRVDSGIFFDIIDWTEQDKLWVDYVQTMWTNFAKYGDPTPTPVTPPGDNTPTTWKKFTTDELNYLDIDYKVEAKVNYRQQNHAFWREYFAYLTGISMGPSPPEGAKSVLDSNEVQDRIEAFIQSMVKTRMENMRQK